MALRTIISAIALLLAGQLQSSAQVPTAPTPVSATKARDIGGYELGMAIGEVRRRMTLAHIAGETFAGTDSDISYEFGFSPRGRIFRIHSVQKLGAFHPDASFARTLSNKLTAKYGAPISNALPGGPISWETIETVQYPSGQKLPYRTMWMNAVLSDADGETTLDITVLDFRILWADQAADNSAPRQTAKERILNRPGTAGGHSV